MNSNFFLIKIFSLIGFASSVVICSCANSGKVDNSGFNVMTIKVGKGAGSVEVADFNKDGSPDIVVANGEDSSVTILIGNGNGKFQEAPGSPFFANRFPNDITIADFNKDGNLDLGIANTEVSFLTVLLGNGNGQFRQAAASPFTVNSKPHTHGIASGDFNGDGNPDLVTDSWAFDKILMLSGDGKGNFGNEVSYNVGKHPYQRLRAMDVDKNGMPDIVTTNLDGNSVTVLLNIGAGNFREAAGSPFAAGDAPFGVAIGDVNGDNNPDLAVVNSPTITASNTGKDGLTILLGDGFGKFSPLKGSPFPTGKSPSRVAIGDLNGDGINDIVTTNYNEKSISLFYMGRKGVIGGRTINVGNRPDGIVVHDLNGDGKNDVAVSNYDDGNIMILLKK